MPEVVLELHWPDGETLSIAELEQKGLAALREASERVRARYGFACTRTDEEALKLQRSITRYNASEHVQIGSSPA
jgi:uncharacterized repeat protein (TIGR04042 family)